MTEVKLRILRARDLVAADSNGLSDPYVLVKAGSGRSQCKTKHKSKTLNPEFDETFILQVENRKDVLSFEVFDWDRFSKDDPIGKGEYSLEELVKDVPTLVTVEVQIEDQGPAGEVDIELTLMAKSRNQASDDEEFDDGV